MKIEFISQGLQNDNNKPVGKILVDNFKNSEFNKFSALVAFASKSGIEGLSKHIEAAKSRFDEIKFIIGIDQQGTSIEALEILNSIDVKAWIYYTTQRIIFHPKIYIFEGTKYSIIIGSSNLTTPGLFQNIESSIHISFEKDDNDGNMVLNQIKDYFKDLFNTSELNIQKLSDELIKDLTEAKLIVNEKDRIIKQNKAKSEINKNRDSENYNKIKSLFPSIKLQKPTEDFANKKDAVKQIEVQIEQEIEDENDILRGNLVWSKFNLPASDVQYSKEGTNPTGGLRLTQANFEINNEFIDQTTYFRNDLFDNYDWSEIRKSPFVEKALIPFNIKINKKDFGTYNLEVRHKPSGEASQGNYTTSLSWGVIGEIIKDLDLRGKTLFLYTSKLDGSEVFELIIE